MADKDLNERETIKCAFPNATVLICLFHTLRTFKREVTSEKMGITQGEVDSLLEKFQEMAYARSTDQYEKIKEEFFSIASISVQSYFEKNWNPLHSEWVLGDKARSGNFLNTTNNRVESFNGKLKSVIQKYSSLEEFLDRFFSLVGTLRVERDHKAAIHFQKTKVVTYVEGSPERKYIDHLTSYTSDFVLKQLELSKKVPEFAQMSDSDSYTLSSNKSIIFTVDGCTCYFYTAMNLPCKHIFALRQKVGVSLFQGSLCNDRWTTNFYKRNCRIFLSNDVSATTTLETDIVHAKPKLTKFKRFRTAQLLTNKIADATSEVTGAIFNHRLEQLTKILAIWNSGSELAIDEISEFKSIIYLFCNIFVYYSLNEKLGNTHLL